MRLLIINCSAKKADVARAPALDLYKGPQFAIVKKAIAAGVEPVEVYIISGKYGLIPGYIVIENYDHKADPATDGHLIPETASRLEVLSHNDYSDVYIGVMSTYQWILPGEATLREWFPNITIRPSMQLGHGYHHLQEWLYGRPMTRDVSHLNRLLVLGATSVRTTKQPGPAWDVYTGADFKALREARDGGVELPHILVLTSTGPIAPQSPAILSLHKPIKDGEPMGKAAALTTILKMQVRLGAFDEVYIGDFKGADYVFADPSVLGDAKIIKGTDLALWLRGEPPVPSTKGKGAKAPAIPIYAQPLPEGCVEPFMVLNCWGKGVIQSAMKMAYIKGYRLQSFHAQYVPSLGEGDRRGATKYTALMAMPQACLF